MPRNQIEQLTKLGDLFADLERLVKSRQALGHTSILKELEGFFLRLLNLIYNWNLVDANDHLSTNAEAIDLIDSAKRISVQVTVTTGATKIRKTLKAFEKAKFYNSYDRVVMIYPFLGITPSKAPFTDDCPSLDFDANKDCLCLDNLLQDLQREVNFSKNEEIINFLQDELGRHGKSEALKIDANVKVIIDVINHLTDDETIPETTESTSVDQDRKFARFTEHAVWLKRQYTGNLDSYASVEACELAIGMDHIRGKRVASWIRFKSDELLEKNGNNAKLAFDDLVILLFQSVGRQIEDSDEIAVRYFLATHLSRCNVFPNPDFYLE